MRSSLPLARRWDHVKVRRDEHGAYKGIPSAEKLAEWTAYPGLATCTQLTLLGRCRIFA